MKRICETAIKRISPFRCIRFTFCLSGRVLAIVTS